MKFDAETSVSASSGTREADGSTRERVLQLVVEKGPISAAQLGRELDLTAAAVRRHLDAMTDQGVVEIKNVAGVRKGAGRPSRRYVISSLGQDALADDYLRLVHAALGLIQRNAAHESQDNAADTGDAVDDQAAAQLAKEYFGQLEDHYAAELDGIEDLDERTEKLSHLFRADSFAGFTRLVGRDNPLLAMQSTQLCQGHCPIREIAGAHPVFCEEETEMISRLLHVDVRRLSTQAAGAHVCTTHVPVGREKLAAERRALALTGTSTTRSAATGTGRKRIVISPRQQERLS